MLTWGGADNAFAAGALAFAGRVVAACVAVVLASVALNFARVRRSGQPAEVTRSPVATASMMAFFVAYYLLIRSRWGVVHVDSHGVVLALTAAGLIGVVAGAVVNVLGRANLGANWADQVTVYEGQTLVTTGLFGLVRHPLYASLIWMFVGAALVYQNSAALAAALLVFVPAMRFRARQEEEALARRFPQYADYRRRVGMLAPRIGRKGP